MVDYNSGRADQKRRTRTALVSVAQELMKAGKPFTVADVAAAAAVSRTTAYRYFPNQEFLCAQAALAIVGASDFDTAYQFFEKSADVPKRLDALVTASHASTSAHAAEYRALLRASLDSTDQNGIPIPRRPRHRYVWLNDALNGIKGKLGPQRYKRLLAALSVFVGIESDIVLSDVFMLKPSAAREIKRWAAQALLKAALSEATTRRL